MSLLKKILHESISDELKNITSNKEFIDFYNNYTHRNHSKIDFSDIEGICDFVAIYLNKKFKAIEYETHTEEVYYKHIFVKYNGKFYDAYNPNGVINFLDLDYFEGLNMELRKQLKNNLEKS